MMKAVRMQVLVPGDRQMTITLPQQVTPGAAEVIFVTSGSGRGVRATALLDPVDAWRAEHPKRLGKEPIDTYLAEALDSWYRDRD